MNDFDIFMRDVVELRKVDGRIFKDIKAQVDTKKVYTHEVKIPFEEGDIICRKLPNGIEELYMIIQAHFYDAFGGAGGIPANYQIEVRKTTRQEIDVSKTINNYNLSGTNSRININSQDMSSNIYNDNVPELFESLRNVIKTELNNDLSLLKDVDDMEANVGKSSFIEKYSSFIQSMANHMQLIVPFIPQLTSLLTNLKTCK